MCFIVRGQVVCASEWFISIVFCLFRVLRCVLSFGTYEVCASAYELVHYLNFMRRGCASACLFSIVFCLLRVLRYVFCSDPVRSYARVSDGVYFDLCAARVCVCVGL